MYNEINKILSFLTIAQRTKVCDPLFDYVVSDDSTEDRIVTKPRTIGLQKLLDNKANWFKVET